MKWIHVVIRTHDRTLVDRQEWTRNPEELTAQCFESAAEVIRSLPNVLNNPAFGIMVDLRIVNPPTQS